MELELVISMVCGMFILALFLYFFRSALVLLLGPAVGLLLYRCCSPKSTTDNFLIAFYLSNVKKIVKFVLMLLHWYIFEMFFNGSIDVGARFAQLGFVFLFDSAMAKN